MSCDPWTMVDEYFEQTLVGEDAVLIEAVENSARAGLRDIQVAPNQGKMLHILALMQGAKRILEIGTLGGYSTIWLARALPEDGALITLEVVPLHAEVARQNIARAGLEDRVEVRLGSAVDSLKAMVEAGEPPFDLVFIDADKPSNPVYLELSLRLSRPGTLIVVDNVVRNGAVVEVNSTSPDVIGVRKMFEQIASNPALTATAIQTVGAKGYDGLALIRVSS